MAKAPRPRMSKLRAKGTLELAVFGAPRSPDNNIEIWGVGLLGGREEYFPSTVPVAPLFPDPQCLVLTDMHHSAQLASGLCSVIKFKLRTSGRVVVGKNIFRLRYPWRPCFPTYSALF